MPEQVAKFAKWIGIETCLGTGAFLIALAIVALLSSSCTTPRKADSGRLTASNKQWAVDLATTPANKLESVYVEAPAGVKLPAKWGAIAGTSVDNRPWILLIPETHY